MKLIAFLFFGFLLVNRASQADTVTDLKSWTIESGVVPDNTKTGPTGGPSFKIDPKGKAVLKLRDVDGSGKVSFYIYDDGKVARPDRQLSPIPPLFSSPPFVVCSVSNSKQQQQYQLQLQPLYSAFSF